MAYTKEVVIRDSIPFTEFLSQISIFCDEGMVTSSDAKCLRKFKDSIKNLQTVGSNGIKVELCFNTPDKLKEFEEAWTTSLFKR